MSNTNHNQTQLTPSPGMAVQGQGGLPHDVRGLAVYDSWLGGAGALAALAVVVALLAALAYSFWRRRSQHQKPAAEPRLQSLQRQIAALQVPEPFSRAAAAEFFYELSMLLRQLVEEVCQFPATDLTLKELKLPLRSYLPLPHEQVEALVRFCERADMIKFADAATSADEAAEALGQVRAWTTVLVRKAAEAPRPADLTAPPQPINP